VCTVFSVTVDIKCFFLSCFFINRFFVSATSSLTALIIFGVRAKDTVIPEDIPSDYLVHYYWSFDVDIAGVVCMFISAVASIQSAYYYYSRNRGYENI